MRYQQAAVASAIIAFAAASPIELEPRAVQFTIAETVPKPFLLSGPASLLKTYGKFGKPAPADVKAAAAANDGTVTASPEVRYLMLQTELAG